MTLQVIESLLDGETDSLPTTTDRVSSSPLTIQVFESLQGELPPDLLPVTTGGASSLLENSLRFTSAGLNEGTSVGLAALFAAEEPAEAAEAAEAAEVAEPDSLEEYFANLP